MFEQEKQRSEQRQKQAHTRKRSEQSGKKQKAQHLPEQGHAGMATDPGTMQDEGYIERMNEKTSKH